MLGLNLNHVRKRGPQRNDFVDLRCSVLINVSKFNYIWYYLKYIQLEGNQSIHEKCKNIITNELLCYFYNCMHKNFAALTIGIYMCASYKV